MFKVREQVRPVSLCVASFPEKHRSQSIANRYLPKSGEGNVGQPRPSCHRPPRHRQGTLRSFRKYRHSPCAKILLETVLRKRRDAAAAKERGFGVKSRSRVCPTKSLFPTVSFLAERIPRAPQEKN